MITNTLGKTVELPTVIHTIKMNKLSIQKATISPYNIKPLEASELL